MRLLLLIALLLTSSGCVWYQDFPRRAATSAQTDGTVSALPVHPGFEQCDFQLQPPLWVRGRPYFLDTPLRGLEVPVQGGKVVFVDPTSKVKRVPQSQAKEVPKDTPLTASELAERGSPPSVAKGVAHKGLTCVARIEIRDAIDPGAKMLSEATQGVIPYVGNSEQISVTFAVSDTQGLTREYSYSFHKALAAGWLVVLFVWMNFFTVSEEEAFQAVFQQFLFDLQRDRMPAAETPGGG